jgi:hypothetical protein
MWISSNPTNTWNFNIDVKIVNMGTCTWIGEHDKDYIYFWIFCWRRRNIGRILFDTWHRIYHMEEFFPCVHGWNIIMDENKKRNNKTKWMKNWNGWTQLVHNQELCANVNYNLFTTKRFLSTETLHVHLQEVCSHWELKQYEATHSHNHFAFFLIELNLSNLLHLRSFFPLEEENYIISPISIWNY